MKKTERGKNVTIIKVASCILLKAGDIRYNQTLIKKAAKQAAEKQVN
jgi:uncharacterized beta-barrel protein YwiB (DUF1934 family)